jgi:hypothetical protein
LNEGTASGIPGAIIDPESFWGAYSELLSVDSEDSVSVVLVSLLVYFTDSLLVYFTVSLLVYFTVSSYLESLLV